MLYAADILVYRHPVIDMGFGKRLSIFLTSLIILCVLYFQYFQYSILNTEFEYKMFVWGSNRVAVYYTILIQVMFMFMFFKIIRSSSKKDFHFVSELCKIIMLFGILSIPLFTYTHLY